MQELPKRKQVVTQERSKVIRETEENPFDDDEDEEPPKPATQTSTSSSSRHGRSGSTSAGQSLADSWSKQDKDKKKKDKSKSKNKRKPFNLEAEKEQMKSAIADSSISSINLMNALQSINREKERISENPMAVERFETCKQLRRRILRYVSRISFYRESERNTRCVTYDLLSGTIRVKY